MRIKEGFILRQVAGKNVVVAVGSASRMLNGMIKLNETGVFCWNCLGKGISEDDLQEALMSEYDIPREQAAADVDAFLDMLREAGCLDEE